MTHALHTFQPAAQVANIFFQLSHAAEKEERRSLIQNRKQTREADVCQAAGSPPTWLWLPLRYSAGPPGTSGLWGISSPGWWSGSAGEWCFCKRARGTDTLRRADLQGSNSVKCAINCFYYVGSDMNNHTAFHKNPIPCSRCDFYLLFYFMPFSPLLPETCDVTIEKGSYLSILDLVSAILLSEDTLKP